MAKQYRLIFLFLIVLIIGVLTSCSTSPNVNYYRADVSNVVLAQIGSMDFYTPKPGEKIDTVFIARQSAPAADFTRHEGGQWYSKYHDKIVSIE